MKNVAHHWMNRIAKQLIVWVLLLCGGNAVASEPVKVTTQADVANYIASMYTLFNWPAKNQLSMDVFEKGMKGYLNLKNAGRLGAAKEILTIVDYSKSANTYRLWIFDLKRKKILFNNYVAHGQGSGEEFATAFSNINDSHQSSLGFFITRGSYMGENGYSMKLEGVDGSFNNMAMSRAIVMHGADYVCKSFIVANKRLGRSWGCPAVAAELAVPIINVLKGGSVLFIYHPTKSYLSKSVWLNKPVSSLPADRFEVEMMAQAKLNGKALPNLKVEVPEAFDETLWLTDSTVIDTIGTSILIRNYERKVPIKILTAEQ